METQEEKYQKTSNYSMLTSLASEPAQAPADVSSMYHMDFTKLCVTRFNHVSEANILDGDLDYAALEM